MRFSCGVRLVMVAALALFLYTAAAASLGYEGKTLTAVRFDPPTQPLLDSDLRAAVSTLKVGQPLAMQDVRGAIERLYATGRYDDIAVDAASESGGVALKFITNDARFVREVSIAGAPEPPNKGQLVNSTKFQLGEEYSDAKLKQSVESVYETLRLNGLYQAKISADVQPVELAQQLDVQIDVDPGKRAKFGPPIIKGSLNRPAPEIVRATKWKRLYGLLGWREVTENRVNQGLDRIRKSYQKKDYLMARIGLDQMEYREDTNRLIPHLTIDSGPKVRVKVTGAKVRKGKLRQLLPIYQEQTVDKDLLVEGQRNLIDFFQAQGYFETAVDFDSVPPSAAGEQVIEYSIFRGERHKLIKLEIDGNKYFDTQTIRERMYLQPASILRFRHGRYSADLLRRDVNAIGDLYRSNGFRDVKVTSKVEDDYQGKEGELAAFLHIEEGPQWFVASLQLNGVAKENFDSVMAMLHSSEGQPFSDLNVATDQETILNHYYNSGYPDATFDATVLPSAKPTQMDLTYTIVEGERQYVRSVLVSGLKTSDPELVNGRIRNLEPGEPLSQSAMIENQRRLYDLGVFARIDTAVQNPDGVLPNKYVLYRFEEARKYSFTAGVGAEIARIGSSAATALDAPAGSPGFSPRISLGISRSNFLGVGHTVSLQTRASNIQRRALLTYFAPQFKGREDLNLTFSGLYDDARDIRTFSAQRQEGSVQLGQRFSKANSAQYRLAYRHVTVDQGTLKITPSLIPLLSQPVTLGIASGTFIQDRRDDPTDARKGIYNSVDLGLASNFFGSKTSFARALGRNATFHRLSREVILARILTMGILSRISRADVPLPERFFSGGATSHRGFPDNQAGPRDLTTGFPVGGKAVLVNTVELRFPLIGDNLGGVLFHDAGNVYSNLGKITLRSTQRNLTDFDYMVHAAGFGIRYRTPVGPLRVDLAYGINSPRFIGFKGTREELLFGGGARTEQRINRFQFHFSLGQAF